MEEQQKYAANSFNNVAQLQLMQMINPAAKKVLDLGCGDGKTTRVLQELLPNAQIYGLTANKEEAEGNSDGTLNIIFGDAHSLPFEDGFFDVVYARHILEHCIAPFIAIKELNRVLSLGGHAIIAVPETNEWADSYVDHYSVLSQSMWEKLFTQCGFTVNNSLIGSWFAWGAAAELPELRFQLEKTSDLSTGEELIHVFSPKIGKVLVEPPKLLTKNPLAFVFHNLVTYETMRNVLFELQGRNIAFDIIVPISTTDTSAQQMFEDTAECISKEFPNVKLGNGFSNLRYKAVFLPFLPFFFSIECDYIVRYQYGIGKAAYNFDIWSMSFDYILCQSSYDFKALRNYTQAKLLGNPKFLKSAQKKPSDEFTILYMPTYGELSSLDERFEYICDLAQKYHVRIKLHHMTLYYEPERVEMIKKIFKNEDILTHQDFLSDLFETTDLVISDTSGAIFDSIQYGVPLVLLKKKGQVFQGEQKSLEDQLVLDKKIPTVFYGDNLEQIDLIVSNYEDYSDAIGLLREQIFPVSNKDVIQNYYSFIDDLLKDNVDTVALEINRKKLLYLTQLETTVDNQNKLLEKLEESYNLQKVELLSLLNDYKDRVKELSEQLINLGEQGVSKDTRIFKLSEQLNSIYEMQSKKDTRITELSEEVSLLSQLQIDKDARIQELSEDLNKLMMVAENDRSED
jgi:ubiquinone/menaquinone biosynthesis C-methylase UbiE